MLDQPQTFRFGDCELDVAGYELRRNGRPIRLERQPMDLLIMLVERRGRLVSRDEIVDRLWGKDVFVDVETGVHTAVRKIRQALRDSRDEPVFIETISGKGYRFIAPVEVVAAQPEAGPPSIPPAMLPADPATIEPSPPPRSRSARLWIGLTAVAILAGVLVWTFLGWNRTPSHVTLAVLPFENLSGDADREYLADGLTEEIIAALGQIDPDHVSVVGRTSVMLYKHAARSLAEIGRDLSADYLLESSIRAETGRLRITAKLIRVRDQLQVWSETYNREAASMLGLQEELSAAIAEQIRFRLSPERSESLARRQPRNAAAYDWYLRGLHFANQRTPPTTRKAIEMYERATGLDPEYALAWAGLALAHAASPVNSDDSPLDVRPRARDAALRAVRADPGLAEAQFALGYVNWLLEWDWPAAETAFRQAIDLDSRYAMAHMTLAHTLSQMGRHGEALPEARRARELDPQNALMYALSSQVAFQARDFPAALDHANQAIALDQGFWIGHIMRGQVLEQLGRHAEALDALATATRFSSSNSKSVAYTGYVLGKTGRGAEAREVLSALEKLSQQRFVPPYALALVHAGLGERDLVFAWLDRAFDTRDVHLMYLTADPKWDPYRADPRFESLLARCSFTGTSKSTGRH